MAFCGVGNAARHTALRSRWCDTKSPHGGAIKAKPAQAAIAELRFDPEKKDRGKE